jgi:hypothetical protein
MCGFFQLYPALHRDRLVTSVETKQFSDSLMACFACRGLFSEPKHLRR